jgi:hypothetical protein
LPDIEHCISAIDIYIDCSAILLWCFQLQGTLFHAVVDGAKLADSGNLRLKPHISDIFSQELELQGKTDFRRYHEAMFGQSNVPING